MEKESPDDGSKYIIKFVVGFKALDDVLEERFDFCRGELVGERGGRGEEWC